MERITKQEYERRLNQAASSIITDRAKLEAFIRSWRQGFHQYSFFNLLFAWVQRWPKGISLLAGYHKWQEKKRQVKKGEKGLLIYRPCLVDEKNPDTKEKTGQKILIGFAAAYVFDIDQTEGEPIEFGEVAVSDYPLDLNLFISKCPYKVEIIDLIREEPTARGYAEKGKIVLKQSASVAAVVKTMLHEWAYHELGHVVDPDSKELIKILPPRDIQEIEAETVAFIICSFYNIKDPGTGHYLGHFGATKEILENRSVNIARAVNKIASCLDLGENVSCETLKETA